jgi:hypothetical protein
MRATDSDPGSSTTTVGCECLYPCSTSAVFVAHLFDGRQPVADSPLYTFARVHDPPVRGTCAGEVRRFLQLGDSKEYNVLTKVSAFCINILEVWVLFIVSFYLAKYVAIGVAFVPVCGTIFNGFTHAIASIVLRRYNPGLYTALVLFLPWGMFLLIYFNAITRPSLLFNGVGLLVGILLHAIILGYALRRRSKLKSRSRGEVEASP